MSEGRWAYFTGSDSETAYHFAHDDEPYHDAAVADYLNALERDLQEALAALAWLVEDLKDCIEEVEGKAYLKEYTKASYMASLAAAAALLARHRKDGAE